MREQAVDPTSPSDPQRQDPARNETAGRDGSGLEASGKKPGLRYDTFTDENPLIFRGTD